LREIIPYLPPRNNNEIKRSANVLGPHAFEGLAVVANNSAKALDLRSTDRDFGTLEHLFGIETGQLLIFTEPQPPVEILDTSGAVFHDLVNRSVTLIGAVDVDESERNRDALALFVDSDFDLAGG
jgi:hypothetical protein